MKKNRFAIQILVVLGFLIAEGFTSLKAQTSYYFYVQLKDKNSTPYSLSNPSQFLSARAISRRASFGISCDSTDLPVNPTYKSQIQNADIQIHSTSKWMNGLTVILSDSSKIQQVRALPFVRFVEYTGLQNGPLLAPQKAKVNFLLDYGIANTQITQLNGKFLHDEGFKGQGIQIGVIDGGFTNVNINPVFDSLRLQGRLLGIKDIINPSSNFYTTDTHGANVLSIMTGNLPGQYLGTAPEASYWLIRTEYGPTEYKVETDFWCSGIEYADSVGVDVVNSSLGYYTFDDNSMGFTYNDMTGKVSRASRAAEMAAKKGIVVVVAAGNEGASAWKYIGSPADADGIIAVGAVTSTGLPSSFTSFGPSYDGRVKPEICAMGTSAAIVNSTGTPTYGNGTSYASPIMAGMMACLLQRYKAYDPSPNVQVLLNSVFKSGNMFLNPTDQMGYGIPDFWNAERNLPIYDSLQQINKSSFTLAYNSTFNTLILRTNNGTVPVNGLLKIYSITGEMIITEKLSNSMTVIRTDKFPLGIYAACIIENGKTETIKIIIR